MFLDYLETDERRDLECAGVRRRFARGTLLMLQHDSDRRVVVLLSGRAKAVRSADDRAVMLSIRDPGEVLGELSYFGGAARVATVTALDDVEAIVIAAAGLAGVLERHPRLAAVLLGVVSRHCREEALMRASLQSSDTLGRLAARVVELADRYGEPGAEGVVIRTPLSQIDLAAWVGASRASVSQGLRDLRRLGWLRTSRGEIVVSDITRLRLRAA